MGLFFSNGDSPTGIFSGFYRTALFSQKLFLHTSLTTSTQKLLFRLYSSCFFKEAPFSKESFPCSSYFFRVPNFSERNFYRAALYENRTFFRAVTFRSSLFFGGVIAYNKDIYRRAPLIEADTSARISFFRRAAFSKSLHFLDSYLFRTATFSKDVSF